jgi:sulfonate transport system substrate-binding protein
VIHAFSRRAVIGGLGAVALCRSAALAAETPPPVIRFAGVNGGYAKPFGTGLIGIVQHFGYIENELKPNNVRIEWQFPAGTGPAINEAIAAGGVDFAAYGDLPQIIGRSAGLPTRIVSGEGSSGYMFLAVRSGVKARTIADLKGLRVSVQRGTILQLLLDRLLAQHGLSESDVQLYDLHTEDQVSSLAAGNIDASLGSTGLLALRDQGVVRIIASVIGGGAGGAGSLLVTDDFAQRYPATTQAVIRAVVKAAHWSSLPENRSTFLDVSALGGIPRNALAEELPGALGAYVNPLIDDRLVDDFKNATAFASQHAIIRTPIDVPGWFDRSFLNAALDELRLQHFWRPRPAVGR